MSESSPLIIQENSCCQLDQYKLEVSGYLGQYFDVYYYKVIVCPSATDVSSPLMTGLLRVGSPQGKLDQECQLRDILGDHKMVSPLLAKVTTNVRCCFQTETQQQVEPIDEGTPDQKTNNTSSLVDEESLSDEENPQEIDDQTSVTNEQSSPKEQEEQPDIELETDDNPYLPEEEEPEILSESDEEKLLILTKLPATEETLEFWFQQNPSLPHTLLICSQICQFFRYLYQQGWCMVSLLPQYITIGNPLEFIDLSNAYPVGESVSLINDYCATEIFYGSHPVDEYTSSYVVGTILYQAIHQTLPPRFDSLNDLGKNWEIPNKQLPKISQILTISLSPIPDERFSLSQLLNLLVKTRQTLNVSKVQWEIASTSTVGLSLHRLKNEDSYGFRQHCPSYSPSIILGIIADGMGGMAKGEVASQTAVKTILEAPLPSDLTLPLKRSQWLTSLVEEANKAVYDQVRDGGTTLSIILAVNQELSIAHVGDSRIYLLRKGQICQLSEDHSYVAMLLASGQISYQDSLDHEDRSMLTKSLGSKSGLSDGYIQDLNRFGGESVLKLEAEDILILCSDGVWDLVSLEELTELFEQSHSLQAAVDQTLEKVLEKGANDNATILSLKCRLEMPNL